MPRSSGGVYSLYTPGNPVVPSTVISSTWANNTLTDLATAMTDSLSRSGDGAMLAPLQLVDGSASGPGLTWGTETSSGWYREASNSFSFSVSGAKKLGVTTNALLLTNSGDAVYNLTNSLASITGSFTTDSGSSRVNVGAVTNHALALVTNNLPRLTITNAGAVAVPGTLDVTGTLTGTTVAATTALTIATVSVRDATNLFNTGTVPAARLPSTFSGLANPSATIGLTANNGSATTAMRSDASPALSQAIAPTWTAKHTFSLPSTFSTNSFAWSADSIAPYFQLNETDGAADAKRWAFGADSGQFQAYMINDAGSAATQWMVVSRSGITAGNINFPNGVLQYGGTEVGYRGLPFVGTDSGTRAIPQGDSGKIIAYNGGAGNTFNFGALTNESLVVVFNLGTASLSIAATSGTMNWMSGAGSVSSGTRTLAVGGICSVCRVSGNWYVWGTGLS